MKRKQLNPSKCLGFVKALKKENRPTKICLICKKPFTWRKKWQRCWEEVMYCSERCKRNKRPNE
jgi:hypothetical protein